jgi:hypothetical protein
LKVERARTIGRARGFGMPLVWHKDVHAIRRWWWWWCQGIPDLGRKLNLEPFRYGRATSLVTRQVAAPKSMVSSA